MPNEGSTASSPAPAALTPQAVVVPLTRHAIFLVLTMTPEAASADAVRSMCGDLGGLIRAVGFRDPEAKLSCVLSIGSDAWDRLFSGPRPRELHPFKEISAGARHAVSTPGDLLFHIRAERPDLCFELASQIMMKLGDAVEVADEVYGFRYFDDRDLLGFVDGTENPAGQEALDFALVGAEDPAFTGGSYVYVQKYIHDLAGWNALPTEAQERIIGRTKLSDIELDDSIKPTSAHNALNTIVDENGNEQKILREGMVFGNAGRGEYGIYFIAYSRTPGVTEQMLQNMFVGRPPGNYDRILDFSRPLTGTAFFSPPIEILDAIAANAPASAPSRNPAENDSSSPAAPASDGSLGIGSLKGERNE